MKYLIIGTWVFFPWVTRLPSIYYLRIGSILACVYRVIDERGKFGEHKGSVRVTQGIAESNVSFLSALQTSHVHPQLDIHAAKSMNQFFYNIVKTK